MLKDTKKPETFLNISLLNSSILSCQTTAEVMQTQIDNYTRRLQQDKRKFFRAQESFSEIKKDYDSKNKQLQNLKTKQYKTQIIALKAKIQTLQAALDQNINSYNEQLFKNNELKKQVNQLRKQKKTEAQKVIYLSQRVQGIKKQILKKLNQIQFKKSAIKSNKQLIMRVKELNDSQLRNHEIEVQTLKFSFEQTARQDRRKRSNTKNQNTENINTQPLLKLRLKNLIARNKQKVKIIDQYKKSMDLIYQNFQLIRQESAIEDLGEITTKVLKQHQQNLFIYEYTNGLNCTVESLKEKKKELIQKITQQKIKNRNQKVNEQLTLSKENEEAQTLQIKKNKLKVIDQLKQLLALIGPKIHQVLKKYCFLKDNQQFSIDQANAQTYFSKLQDLINSSNFNLSNFYKLDFKEDVTRYTKLPPTLAEQTKDKNQEKFLEQGKLKQIAEQFWERKKNTKPVPNKIQDCLEDQF